MPAEDYALSRIMHPFSVDGTVRVRPSKSALHRALICAALADGKSHITNFAYSADISATMGALESLGLARFTTQDSVCVVHGGLHGKPRIEIDCGESGTTQRMLFPLTLDGSRHILKGHGRLPQRPFGPYEDMCRQEGFTFRRTASGIESEGILRSMDVEMPGNVSSQFVSGYLLGLARMSGTSHVQLTSPLESAPYVDMTRDIMHRFGVETEYDDASRTFTVPGGQRYHPADIEIEGDYSHAAFFAAAAALSGRVALTGLRRDSLQGDCAILDILRQAGANVRWMDDGSVVVQQDRLCAIDQDVSQIPDLVPVLASLACGAHGTSYLRNAARLREKESDRLEAMRMELNNIGAHVEEEADMLVVHADKPLTGGVADAHNDHRVAMALCVAALASRRPVLVAGTNCVRKSAPEFFQDWNRIGGTVV